MSSDKHQIALVYIMVHLGLLWAEWWLSPGNTSIYVGKYVGKRIQRIHQPVKVNKFRSRNKFTIVMRGQLIEIQVYKHVYSQIFLKIHLVELIQNFFVYTEMFSTACLQICVSLPSSLPDNYCVLFMYAKYTRLTWCGPAESHTATE